MEYVGWKHTNTLIMAKDKKSFLLYTDIIHTIEKLSDEKAGQLFKHILSYVNDLNPISDDVLLNIAFEPIKQQLKRDLKKYESICNRNKINGSKGGRPLNPDEPKKPSGIITNPDEPKKPDNDNDNDNDNVINISFDVFWNLYDKKIGEKGKLEKKWNRLSDNDRSKIIQHIPKYKLSQPDKKYRKNPETYLNNKSWNDEIIINSFSQILVEKISNPYNSLLKPEFQ